MAHSEGELACYAADQEYSFVTGVGHRIGIRMSLPIDTLVFDESALHNFFRSIARTVVLERHTRRRARWGIVEIVVEREGSIESEVRSERARLEEEFVTAMAQGATRVVGFLNEQEAIRDNALASVRQLYAEAGGENERRRSLARAGVIGLSVIKAASTITVKTIALTAAAPIAVPAFLVGTGYDIALSVVGDWHRAPSAVLVGVGSKVAKKSAKKGLEIGVERAAVFIENEASNAAHQVGWMRRRVGEIEEGLARRVDEAKLKKVSKMKRKLARAEREVAVAGNKATGLRTIKYAVKYGFFAWDVFSAVKEVRDTTREAR